MTDIVLSILFISLLLILIGNSRSLKPKCQWIFISETICAQIFFAWTETTRLLPLLLVSTITGIFALIPPFSPLCGDLLGQLLQGNHFPANTHGWVARETSRQERGLSEIHWVPQGLEDDCWHPWEPFRHPSNLLCLSQSPWTTSTAVPTITRASWGLPSFKAQTQGGAPLSSKPTAASANRRPALWGSYLASLLAIMFLMQIFS